MSCQKHRITSILLLRLRPVDVQVAEFSKALQKVCDEPVVGHCLRDAPATGHAQVHLAGLKRGIRKKPVAHPLPVMRGVLASLVAAPVASTAVVISADDGDGQAGRLSCKTRERYLFRGVVGAGIVELRDGDSVVVLVGCDTLVVLGFKLLVDEAKLRDGSADVEAKVIGLLFDLLPEVVVDHVAQLSRQGEELEDHLGIAGSWR